SRNTPLRRRVQANVLADALGKLVHDACPLKETLLALLAKLPSDEEASTKPEVGKVSGVGAGTVAGEAQVTEKHTATVGESEELSPSSLPEVEVYMSTLVLTTLLRHKAVGDAVGLAPALLERALSFNRR
ncbi:unnamed protein product, partial [Choristocarpus tenellus]